MMMNLFSIFDPSLSIFSFSWIVIFCCVLFLPSFFWGFGIFGGIYSSLGSMFLKEVDYGMSFSSKGVYKFVIMIFSLVVLFNFFALFPHIFCVTSHLLVTFPISYSFWLGIVFFSLFKSIKDFFVHLIPVGTPLGLISFMVVVELLSNLIRPMALTFRLTANMMAGHLLMSLIGGALVMMPLGVMCLGSMVQGLLVFMELGVSVIQAYVFTSLLLLYMSESEAH